VYIYISIPVCNVYIFLFQDSQQYNYWGVRVL